MDTEALAASAHRARLKVAIDGPAGAGKSSVGAIIARALRCPEVDTGLMYRAVTLEALKSAVSLADEEELARIASGIRFGFDASLRLTIDGQSPAAALRGADVDAHVSQVSAHPKVRRTLVRCQRELADERCIVMIGRDIGTVVLPDAAVKLWITASAEERARRRLGESLPGMAMASVLDMAAQIDQRDLLDSRRPISPLKQASDAVVLVTDGLSVTEVVRKALGHIQQALEKEQATRA